MFNSNRKLVKFVALLTLVTSPLGTGTKAQGSGSKNLAWAQEFLSTFYPEMSGHRYVITASTSHPFDVPDASMGNLSIQVGEMPPGTVMGIGSNTGPIHAKQFVSAFFTFDKLGRLDTFASEGPGVGKPEEYERLKEAVRSHSEWTEAQADSALMGAAASYGPGPDAKQKIIGSLPLDRLEKLLGRVTVISSEFESLTEGGTPRLPLFRWAVTVSVRYPEGDEQKYKMYFEPFKGALIGMESVAR